MIASDAWFNLKRAGKQARWVVLGVLATCLLAGVLLALYIAGAMVYLLLTMPGDVILPLPNDYLMAGNTAGLAMIYEAWPERGGMLPDLDPLVPGPIVGMAVIGDVVVGTEVAGDRGEEVTYFVLDTRDGTLRRQMGITEWEGVLRGEYGISPDEVELRSPRDLSDEFWAEENAPSEQEGAD